MYYTVNDHFQTKDQKKNFHWKNLRSINRPLILLLTMMSTELVTSCPKPSTTFRNNSRVLDIINLEIIQLLSKSNKHPCLMMKSVLASHVQDFICWKILQHFAIQLHCSIVTPACGLTALLEAKNSSYWCKMIQGTNKTTQMSVVGALLEAERANREKCLKKHNTWPLLWSDDQHRTASLIMVVNCAIGKMMKSFFFSLFFFWPSDSSSFFSRQRPSCFH